MAQRESVPHPGCGGEWCEYVPVANVEAGPVSLDCFGLVCSACGHVQIDLRAVPDTCPGCGRPVRPAAEQ